MSAPAQGPLSPVWRAVAVSGAAAFALALLPALFGQSYFGLDLTRVDLPFQCELRGHLQRLEGLGLSRAIGNGEPLFANPHAQALYPLRWLQALLPQFAGLQLGCALHLGLAAAGTAWLAVSFGVRGPLAAAVGLMAMLTGTSLDLIGHGPYLLDAAWLGWAWAGARFLLAGEQQVVAAAALVAASAAFLLGGEPLGFVLASGLVALEIAVRAATRERPLRALLGPAALAGAAVALGAVIGLAQWATTWPELRLGGHGGGLPAGMILHWPFELPHLLGLVLPGALPAAVQGSDNLWTALAAAQGLRGAAVDGTWNPTPFLGFPCLFLAAFSAGRRETRTLALALLVGALLAAGAHTPVLPALLELLPPLRSFRYPSKYFVLCNLAAVVLAGVSLQAIGADLAARRLAGRAALAVLAGLVALCGALALAAPSLERWLLSGARAPAALDGALAVPTATALLSRLLLQETALFALGALLLLLPRARAAVLPGLVLLDLLLAALSSVTLGPDPFSGRAPLATGQPAAPGGDVHCASEDLFRAQHQGGPGSGDELLWDLARASKTFSLPNLNACDGVVSGIPYSILQPAIRKQLREGVDLHRASAARALGCTHLVSLQAPLDGQVTPAAVDPFAGVAVAGRRPGLFVIDDPIPPAFVARYARWADPRTDLLGAVSRSRSARELEELVDDPEGRLPPASQLPAGDAVSGVEVRWEGPARASVALQGTGTAVVGLRTTYAAGWRATQGGATLPVVRVAASFVAAVTADAARGPVTFEYRIPNLRLGLCCGLAGLVASAGLLFWLSRRRAA